MLVEIRGGSKVDIPSLREIHEVVAAELRETARGVKFLRLPTSLQGKAASNAITLGITKGQPPVGPEQGWAWSIRDLEVTGLTASAGTPDIVNIYLNDNFTGPLWWQFNGNSPGYTFNLGEKILMPGETLSLQNVGNIASTSLIILSGGYWQAPAEMIWKLSGM